MLLQSQSMFSEPSHQLARFVAEFPYFFLVDDIADNWGLGLVTCVNNLV
jgi:hypothetical protein